MELSLILTNVVLGFLIVHFSRHPQLWQEYLPPVGIAIAISIIAIGIGTWSAYADFEIYNGKIISKDRIHDTYEDPYDCFCTTDANGYRSCRTCYETRYTVDWVAKTTVGNITFKSLDSGFRSVYSEPDPKVYTNCKIGEPVSLEKTFMNYIKGSPESLFNDSMLADGQKVPAYPRVHNFYKVDRIINLSKKVTQEQTKELDKLLDEALISLGSKKQVNVIGIVTDNPDSFYRNHVENAWIGGKKNDVVVFWSTSGWRDVMTFGKNIGNEFFVVNLRDELTKMETFDAVEISNSIVKNVGKYYDRPKMSSFEYLKEEQTTSIWLIFLSILFTGFCSFVYCVKYNFYGQWR